MEWTRISGESVRVTIDQVIDGKRVVFTRDWFTGRARISIDGLEHTLQSPLDPATHFELSLKQTWICHVGVRILRIEKIRPLMFAGFRPQTYRLSVDGVPIAERRGF